jgi:hypothetical protein
MREHMLSRRSDSADSSHRSDLSHLGDRRDQSCQSHKGDLSHLSDAALLRELGALVAQDRLTTAAVLAHIAEVDARKLYAPEGYSSMHEFCVRELRLSDDAAFARIRAARTARRFPAIFDAVADGRLHVTGICFLAPYLTPENAEELLRAAEGRRKSEIEEMLAQRFTVPEVPPIVRACQVVSTLERECDTQLVPERVEVSIDTDANLTSIDDAKVAAAEEKVVTPPPERYPLRLSVYKSTREKLRYAQALLSHAVPDGDVAEVLDRALDALIAQLEKRKFGGSPRPRAPREKGANGNGPNGHGANGSGATTTAGPSASGRYIPAHVRRAVWKRDQGRCTFVSASGHRCGARRFLEFDHIVPLARGGEATVDGMRLRCRAHNQYEAERAFGKGFMEEKRREARPPSRPNPATPRSSSSRSGRGRRRRTRPR